MSKSVNKVLWLKNGKFLSKKGNTPGNPNIPKNAFVSIEHLKSLLEDLKQLIQFWIQENKKIL